MQTPHYNEFIYNLKSNLQKQQEKSLDEFQKESLRNLEIIEYT